MEDKVTELRKKIQAMKQVGETAMAQKFEAELAKLTAGNPAPAAAAGFGVVDISQDEVEKSTSKFALPGLHEAEFGMPEWKTQGQSLAFPFTITEVGPDSGKEHEMVCGISKAAIWKFNETLAGLEITAEYTNDKLDLGKTLIKVPGKKALVLYVQQKDSRSVEEGGKGTIYTKPVKVVPVGTTLEKLGMTEKSLLVESLGI